MYHHHFEGIDFRSIQLESGFYCCIIKYLCTFLLLISHLGISSFSLNELPYLRFCAQKNAHCAPKRKFLIIFVGRKHCDYLQNLEFRFIFANKSILKLKFTVIWFWANTINRMARIIVFYMQNFNKYAAIHTVIISKSIQGFLPYHPIKFRFRFLYVF